MLLDSNIIIYAAIPAHRFLREIIRRKSPLVPAVAKVEVLGYHSLDATSKRYFERFFSVVELLPISPSIIDQATLLRQQKKMSLGDALIAAIALENNLTLLSRNKTDFQHIGSLKVIDPFEEPV